MNSLRVRTLQNNYLDAQIHHADCVADRARHLSADPPDGDVRWWLEDLRDHDVRVAAAAQLLERRRRELAALKVAA